VAYADRSFRRHLAIHRHVKWTVLRRGQHPREEFTLMTAAEAWERRVTLSSRQGGRGDRRRQRLMDSRQAERNCMPPPPRPPHVRQQTLPPFSSQRGGGNDTPRLASYIPAGYRDDSPETVSSLSEGGIHLLTDSYRMS